MCLICAIHQFVDAVRLFFYRISGYKNTLLDSLITTLPILNLLLLERLYMCHGAGVSHFTVLLSAFLRQYHLQRLQGFRQHLAFPLRHPQL